MITNYNIDVKKLIEWTLPSFWRKKKRVAWLYDLLKPLRDIHAAFVPFMEARKEEMKWNGQRLILERFLINRYGAGIEVILQDYVPIPIEYQLTDSRNPIKYPISNLKNPIEYEMTGTPPGDGFIINVPGAISFDMDEMIKLVKKYRIGGFPFSINIV